jgi:hypothetical protein
MALIGSAAEREPRSGGLGRKQFDRGVAVAVGHLVQAVQEQRDPAAVESS